MKTLVVILLICCLILIALYLYNAYAVKSNKAAIDEYMKYSINEQTKKHTIKIKEPEQKEKIEEKINVYNLEY